MECQSRILILLITGEAEKRGKRRRRGSSKRGSSLPGTAGVNGAEPIAFVDD